MRVSRWIGAALALLSLTGCVYALRDAGRGRHVSVNRPHASYYCYDCHGYRYFDPYYDWCPGYGFRYAWDRNPRVIAQYRARYLALRREHRDYGRYSYPRDYRRLRSYREPLDYEVWRGTTEGRGDTPRKIREQRRRDSGTREREASERADPRRGLELRPREDAS